MHWSKRLAKMIDEKGLSQTKVEDRAGLGHGRISQMKNGHEPRVTDAIRLCRFLGVDVEDFFMTGDAKPAKKIAGGETKPGRSLKPAAGWKQFQISQGVYRGEKSFHLAGRSEMIESEDGFGRAGFIPVVAPIAAGEPKEAHDGGFPAGAAEAFVQFQVDDPNAFALRVDGDSMAPDFRHGDVIIVSPKLGQPAGMYRDGMVGVVIFGSERTATFKIVRTGKVNEQKHEPFDYLLLPINPVHPKMRLKTGEIAAILPVVGLVRRD